MLVYLPSRVLAWAGVSRPEHLGVPQVAGLVIGAIGALLALWCVFTFALIGRGTPAAFDPPRRLVERGPYALLRNPMYLGAALALAGAAGLYGSLALLAFCGIFVIVSHLFVVYYEEPTLRRLFGEDYGAYCRRVARWRPRWPRRGTPSGVV